MERQTLLLGGPRGLLGSRRLGGGLLGHSLASCHLLGRSLGRCLLGGGLCRSLLGRSLRRITALELGLAQSGSGRNEPSAAESDPLGCLLDGRDVGGQRLGAGHKVLEVLASAEARYRGLLDPDAFPSLGVARVASRSVDLLERAETGDRDSITLDRGLDDGAEHHIDRLSSSQVLFVRLGRDGFDELSLIHEQITPCVAPDVRTIKLYNVLIIKSIDHGVSTVVFERDASRLLYRLQQQP